MKCRVVIVLLMSLLVGNGFSQVEEMPPPPPPIAPSEKENVEKPVSDIVDFPDVEAEFPGGPEAMKDYIRNNVVYPKKSLKKGDQGRVYVVFIVERDGSISAVEVMRGGLTKELNREAMRLVREMPTWTPAEVNGKTVRARCRLPITFILT